MGKFGYNASGAGQKPIFGAHFWWDSEIMENSATGEIIFPFSVFFLR